MAKCVSIPVILHTPERKEALQKLERQLADVYAEYIITTVSKLDCPPEQKLELLQSVINTIQRKEFE